MPEVDGFELADEIRKNPKLQESSLVMLTSVGLRGNAARCREVGIKAYLTKPIKRSDLLEAINQVLRPRNHQPDIQPLVTAHFLHESRTALKILLAEDNRVNQVLAIRLLEKRGHFRPGGDSKAVLEAVEKQTFDLVLMDVQMPEMDGLEATMAIRQREKISGKHLAIIAMTDNMISDKERCLQSGMDGYLTKPLSVKELFAAIEKRVTSPMTAASADLPASQLPDPKQYAI
jgi:two-component system sensor histidine kinase/response regulator